MDLNEKIEKARVNYLEQQQSQPKYDLLWLDWILDTKTKVTVETRNRKLELFLEKEAYESILSVFIELAPEHTKKCIEIVSPYNVEVLKIVYGGYEISFYKIDK